MAHHARMTLVHQRAQMDLKSQFVTDRTGALEVKGTGLVAKTAEALESVPLIVAPLLEQDVLGQVRISLCCHHVLVVIISFLCARSRR